MKTSELLKEKYPQHIIENVRQRLGLEFDDETMDSEILEMTSGEVFKHVVNWNGLLGGYDDTIKRWIYHIYGIDLDDKEKEGLQHESN